MGYPTIGDKGGKRGFVQTCYIIYLHFLSAVFYGENDEKTTGCRGYPTVFGDSRVDIHKTNTHTHTPRQGFHQPREAFTRPKDWSLGQNECPSQNCPK